MKIDECIRELRHLGYTVEPDPRSCHESNWLLFSPEKSPGSGEPDFFSDDQLIAWSKEFLLPKRPLAEK
ncbi:hypothetical protein P2C08_08970 [Xanthomonas perforans]|uniref:hypothetical protein n=1 Tax=Xanthomonas TaxID=338 RepID=UPI0011B21144|nr:hypothetical protein [Xanthomonas perforans]